MLVSILLGSLTIDVAALLRRPAVVFTADLVAKFFVAFFDGDTGMLVTSPARIARSYVFRWRNCVGHVMLGRQACR